MATHKNKEELLETTIDKEVKKTVDKYNTEHRDQPVETEKKKIPASVEFHGNNI